MDVLNGEVLFHFLKNTDGTIIHTAEGAFSSLVLFFGLFPLLEHSFAAFLLFWPNEENLPQA